MLNLKFKLTGTCRFKLYFKFEFSFNLNFKLISPGKQFELQLKLQAHNAT